MTRLFRFTNRLKRCKKDMPLILHVSCSHHSLSAVENEFIVSLRSAIKRVSFAACFMRFNLPASISVTPSRGRLRSIIRYSSIGKMTPIGLPSASLIICLLRTDIDIRKPPECYKSHAFRDTISFILKASNYQACSQSQMGNDLKPDEDHRAPVKGENHHRHLLQVTSHGTYCVSVYGYSIICSAFIGFIPCSCKISRSFTIEQWVIFTLAGLDSVTVRKWMQLTRSQRELVSSYHITLRKNENATQQERRLPDSSCSFPANRLQAVSLPGARTRNNYHGVPFSRRARLFPEFTRFEGNKKSLEKNLINRSS